MMDEYLSQVYYNPKRTGGLGGVERLYGTLKKMGSTISLEPNLKNG